MAGDPEAARMGDPMTIEDDQIGPFLQPLPRSDQGGQLTKREVARDIGEVDLDLCTRRVYNLLRLSIENDEASISISAMTGDREVGSDRKSTRLNSSHVAHSYAVFCLNRQRNTA